MRISGMRCSIQNGAKIVPRNQTNKNMSHKNNEFSLLSVEIDR